MSFPFLKNAEQEKVHDQHYDEELLLSDDDDEDDEEEMIDEEERDADERESFDRNEDMGPRSDEDDPSKEANMRGEMPLMSEEQGEIARESQRVKWKETERPSTRGREGAVRPTPSEGRQMPSMEMANEARGMGQMKGGMMDMDGVREDATEAEVLRQRLQEVGAWEEVKELTSHVERYKPRRINLDARLKPFIPDSMPATGEVDEFLKPARPDGREETLGLEVLDEPGPNQSEPSTLTLKLKEAGAAGAEEEEREASIVQHEDISPSRLDSWIESVEGVHKSRPKSGKLTQSKQRDVNTAALTEAWPPEVERVIRSMRMPDGSLDMRTDEMAKCLCACLGIPVKDNVCESLHTLYSLHLELSKSSENGEEEG